MKLAEIRAKAVLATTKSRKKLEEQAKTDPEAAEKLAWHREKSLQATNKCNANIKLLAEQGD